MHCAGKSSYVYCRLSHSSGDFKNHINLVLCIIGSDYNIKLYVLDPFHLQAVNNLSKLNQSIYSQDHPKRTSADMKLRNLPKP